MWRGFREERPKRSFTKSISALNSDEREIFKTIYLVRGDVNSKDVYKILKAELNTNKLESLKLINIVWEERKKEG